MADQVSDSTLLKRFVTCREEAAFAALVQRHGPRVVGACRRILRNEHDVEDVFQATFLVLARKAADVAWRESVGGWLCAVAQRLSLNTRSGVSRRYRYESPVAALAGGGPGYGGHPLPEEYHPQADPLTEIARRELRRVLDDELGRLPEKYRAPVVLCYFEGLTNEEAARQLGWPAGSMSRRLERARALLRQRLAGRGLPLAIVLLGALLATLWAWSTDPRGEGELAPVREAMAPFRRPEGGGQDIEWLFAQVDQAQQPAPGRDEVLRIAGQSALVAERIRDYDPGRDRATWRLFAEEMLESALQLAQAARADDDADILAAARRLNESCLRCHGTFVRRASGSATPSGGRRDRRVSSSWTRPVPTPRPFYRMQAIRGRTLASSPA